MNREELLALYDRLVEAGYRVYLEFSYYSTKPTFKIHNISSLRKLKKALGVPKIEKHVWSDKSGMSARAELDDVSFVIYPENQAFEGCRIVEEVVEVPDMIIPEKFVPAHTEVRRKVECGKHS